jgi:hypothetical protein
LEWEGFGVQPMLGCSRLLADPRFPEAARTLARNMLDLCADAGLRGLFKDAGRYLVAMCALYLHGEGELTLARLKQLSAASGFLSEGRARALLLYLRHLGYIEPLADQGEHGTAHYVPTEAFLGAWTRHLRAAMAAAAVIEPGVRPLLDVLDQPDIAELVNRIQAEGLLPPSGPDEVAAPYVRVFLDRHAGSQIGWMLMIGDGNAEGFPATGGISFSVAAAARRFDVSRAHVRRLLADARAEGLIEDHGDGMIGFAEGCRGFLQLFYAMQLVQLLASAATALHRHAVPERRRAIKNVQLPTWAPELF